MNPRPLDILRFTIDDYENIVCLWKACSLPYKSSGRDSRNSIEKELDHASTEFWVAEINKCPAGSIFGTHDGRKGWINRLAVHPDYQRQGVAGALVAKVETQFKRCGIQIIACLIEEWNVDSRKFFEQQDYLIHNEIHYYSKRENHDV